MPLLRLARSYGHDFTLKLSRAMGGWKCYAFDEAGSFIASCLSTSEAGALDGCRRMVYAYARRFAGQ